MLGRQGQPAVASTQHHSTCGEGGNLAAGGEIENNVQVHKVNLAMHGLQVHAIEQWP